MFEVKIRILNFVLSFSLNRNNSISRKMFKSNIVNNPETSFVEKIEFIIDNYSLKQAIKKIQRLPEYEKYSGAKEFARVMRIISDKKTGYSFNNFKKSLSKYQ